MKKNMKKYIALALIVILLLAFSSASAMVVDGVDYPNLDYISYGASFNNSKATELFNMINNARTSGDAWYYNSDGTVRQLGVLPALVWDNSLAEAARFRAAQLGILYRHDLPSGHQSIYLQPEIMAECIARPMAGTSTSYIFDLFYEEDCNFSAQGHRRIMLSSQLTHVGIGCAVVNGVNCWAMEFSIGKTTMPTQNIYMSSSSVTTLINYSWLSNYVNSISIQASPASIKIKEGSSVAIPEITIPIKPLSYMSAIKTIPQTTTLDIQDKTIARIDEPYVVALKQGTTKLIVTCFGRTIEVPITVEHNLVERTVTPASHTEEGKKEIYCTFCGIVTETVGIPKTTKHTEAERITGEASCTAEGVKEIYCSECDEVLETVSIPKLDHILTHHEGTVTSCSVPGTEEYWSCDVCRNLFSDAEGKNMIDAPVTGLLPHTLNAHAGTATCTEAGIAPYWSCDVCENLFSDAEGKHEIAKPQEVSSLGHAWSAPTYTWSKDYTSVTASHTCTREGITETETVAATLKVTSAASAKANGTITCTGKAFRDENFAVQEKTVAYPLTYKDSNCKYTISDKLTAAVTGPAKSTLTGVTIPDTITVKGITMKVTKIDIGAFSGNTKLKAVSIGKNVAWISAKAFYKCTALTKVGGMAGLTSIGASAFQGCTALKGFTIHANVSKIGKNAFNGDKNLKTLIVRSSKLKTDTVGDGVFKGIYSKVTVKCPAKQMKTCKALLIKKGVPKTAEFVKIQ